jgi:hypothetical protein
LIEIEEGAMHVDNSARKANEVHYYNHPTIFQTPRWQRPKDFALGGLAGALLVAVAEGASGAFFGNLFRSQPIIPPQPPAAVASTEQPNYKLGVSVSERPQ